MKPEEAQSLMSALDHEFSDRYEYEKSHPGFMEWTHYDYGDPDAARQARAEWEAFEKWRADDDASRSWWNRRTKWTPYSRDPFLGMKIWAQHMSDLDKYVNDVGADSKYLWRKGDPAYFLGIDGKWHGANGEVLPFNMVRRKKKESKWVANYKGNGSGDSTMKQAADDSSGTGKWRPPNRSLGTAPMAAGITLPSVFFGARGLRNTPDTVGKKIEKRAFNVKQLAPGVKDTEKFVNLLMKKLSRRRLDRMVAIQPRTYGELNLAAQRAARKAHDLGLPDTHPSWAGIRRSFAQLADDSDRTVDAIRSNGSSRQLMASMARALLDAGATSFTP